MEENAEQKPVFETGPRLPFYTTQLRAPLLIASLFVARSRIAESLI